MNEHEKINYVEFPAKDLPAAKDFFARAFGRSFEDFGPHYTAFAAQGLDGGFFKSELASTTKKRRSVDRLLQSRSRSNVG